MKTGTVEFLPVTFLTDTELSRTLASSPDELAQEAAHRLAESVDTLVQTTTAYADTLEDISGSLYNTLDLLVDVMDTLHPAQSDLFTRLDHIRSALEALSASVSAKAEEL